MTLKPESPASIRQQVLIGVKVLRQTGQHTVSLAVLESALEKLSWHLELAGHFSEGLRRVGRSEQALKIINDTIEKELIA